MGCTICAGPNQSEFPSLQGHSSGKPIELIGTQENFVVAIYESHTGAEAALKELRKAGDGLHQNEASTPLP